jgi:hypothetical protein
MNSNTAQAALGRARDNSSMSNYPAIIMGFMEKGIPQHDIKPRVNVFTYGAWKGLNRVVKRGEHGVRINTFVAMAKSVVNEETGENETRSFRAPRMTTVFHISQTQTV